MLLYWQTTLLICLWCVVFGLGWAVASYYLALSSPRLATKMSHMQGGGLPAVLLGPALIFLAYGAFQINLIFPVHLLSTTSQILWHAMLPAMVLLTASGFLTGSLGQIGHEILFWQRSTFYQHALSCGISGRRTLTRLVLVKSLTEVLSRSLPWIFSELLIVEIVFNAPGLGLASWHLARTRQLFELAQCLSSICAVYALAQLANYSMHRWVGRRLASYG